MKAFSRLNLAAGANERRPIFSTNMFGKENFDTASRIRRTGLRVRAASASGVETSRNNAAVVEDQQIARMKQVRQIAEEVVAVFGGGAVEDEHAAGATDRRRRLGDEFFGEIEMEVGYTHCLILVCGAVATLCGILRVLLRGRARPARRLARLGLEQSTRR